MQTRPLPFWLMIVSIAIAVLPGLAVADDQLALAAADRDERVDRLDAGLDRRVDRLADDDAGGDALDRAGSSSCRSGPCRRAGGRAGRRRGRAAPGRPGTSTTRPVVLTVSPSLIARGVAEDDRADRLLLEVEGHAHDPAGELEHLRGERAVEPVDLGDAVADLDDRADVARLDARVERVDGGLDDAGDLVGADGHACESPRGRPRASWFRSRSRRPRTLPSIRRSPTRTMRPPSRLGSTVDVERDAAAGHLLEPRR